MNKEFDYLEKEFEKGWSKFIKEKRKENLAKNERVFKVLINLKGDLFANQLKQMMAHIGCTYSILHIVREPIGFEMNERRFSEIKTVWVDQKSSSEGYLGSICVQVKPDKWIKMFYSVEGSIK